MKQIIKNTFFFIASFVAIIIVLDIFITYSFIETKSPTDYTEEYGRCRKQNMDYVYFNEGFSMGNFNEGRYVNSYYPKEKPNNIIRIAALGDSYVEGFQVFERNHFLKIAETKLNANSKDSVQILNFGRSGFDFGDMYVYYKTLIEQYNCDIVMFFINNADLNIKQTDVLIPKLKYDNDSLFITNSEMPIIYKDQYIKQLLIAKYSTIYKMLNDSRKLIKSGELFPKLFDKFYMSSVGNIVKFYPNEKNIIISDLSYRILYKLQKEVPKIIIVNRDKDNLDPNFTSKVEKTLFFFNLSQESGLYGNNNDPHYWNISNKRGHWNLEGHKIVGNELTKSLIENKKL